MRTRTALIWLLTSLWLVPALSHAQPSWYTSPERHYAQAQYLTGLGTSTESDRTTRLQRAAENARSDLIKSIRTRISSEFVGQTTDTSGRVDEYAQSRVVSSASLEVDGIQIAKQEDHKNTAYALAVLPKQTGQFLHSQKLAQLEQEIDQGFAAAKTYEEAGQTEPALRAFLRLCPLLARREETQVILLALGDFSGPAFEELDHLTGAGIPTSTVVDAAIERLTRGGFTQFDDAALALAFRLGVQLPPGRKVLVLPFTWGETRFASPFSRYLAQAVSHKLADQGLQPVQQPPAYQPQGTDLRRELGRQAGADLVVQGPYLPKGQALQVFAVASEVETGRRVGAADVAVDTTLIAQEHLEYLPQNFAQALQDASVWGKGELVGGGLQLEAWTDRGAQHVLLEEGEKVTLGVRVNQPCYVQLTYHLADGKRVLFYDNYYIDAAKVNHAVTLPDTFLVSAPFGVEVLNAFAGTEPFPPVQVVTWQGYPVLAEDLGTYVARTRGLKKQQKTLELAETRVTITTMSVRPEQ
jgi:hypothetical protein